MMSGIFGNRRRGSGLLCILCLFGISISSSIAVAQPPIPADYSGSVTVNGELAPDNTEVFAKTENYTSDSVTTTGGSYEYLVVDPPNDTYVGKTIEFWVDAPGDLSPVKAVETDVFDPGTSHSSFNLMVTTPEAEDQNPSPFPWALVSSIIAIVFVLIMGVWYWRRGR